MVIHKLSNERSRILIQINNIKEKAFEKRKKGYNCAQSVICAFCDALNTDEKTLFKLSEGFGGGMGGMQETCGAVTAMFLAAGLLNSDGNTDAPGSKRSTYMLIQEFARAFKEKNKSIICKELKGLTDKKIFRSCEGCIEDACNILENFLNEYKESDTSKLVIK